MDAVEVALKILPGDATLQQQLDALAKEGWQPIAGTMPVITYVMMRTMAPVQQASPADQPGQAGFGVLTIDDSKVHHYRNGKLVEYGNG